MKRRTGYTFFIVLFTLLAIGLALGYAYLEYKALPGESFASDEAERIDQLLETNAEVTLDRNTGVLFVNNEIIVMAAEGAGRSDIDRIAKENGAVISDAMEDIGVYQLRFSKSMSINAVNALIARIEKSEHVESAFINPVTLGDEDVQAVYPDDPWNNAGWSTETPAGENWGMEAIRAPQAWAYLDELESVNIGLIDSMPDMTHDDLDIAAATISCYDLDNQVWNTWSVDNTDMAADDHGTHVAGIMAAAWNETGVSGVAGDRARVYYSNAYNIRDNKEVDVYGTAYTYVKAINELLKNDVCAINISQNTSRLIGFAASHGNQNAINHVNAQAELAGQMLKRIIDQRNERSEQDFVICISAGNSNNTRYYRDRNAQYGFTEDWNIFNIWNSEKGNSLAEYNNFLCAIDVEEVKDRIIVVGAAKIAKTDGNGKVRYEYTDFSNVGARVDITAPGYAIYSTVAYDNYDNLSGTSMSAPHVTAACGLVFAANPTLTGPQVKQIILASAYGKFMYTGGESGMLDLSKAIEAALETEHKEVEKVINQTSEGALDLCFLVDTTGSMGDDIDNAKKNMVRILDALAAKTADYRVAVIDYRDFSERTTYSYDYPAKLQLDFSSNHQEIVAAVNALTLGHGGDNNETVFSGFGEALKLGWRPNSTKVIIVLGDAAPLDPEPNTGYTYDSIVAALYNADIAIDVDASDKRVLGSAQDSRIKIFTIGTNASSDAIEFFSEISEETGGAYTDVRNASSVADAIEESIESIEIEKPLPTLLSFGSDFSGEIVEIYGKEEFLFAVPLNRAGEAYVSGLVESEYTFEIERLGRSGSILITDGAEKGYVEMIEAPWTAKFVSIWHRDRLPALVYTELALISMIVFLKLVRGILRIGDRRRSMR